MLEASSRDVLFACVIEVLTKISIIYRWTVRVWKLDNAVGLKEIDLRDNYSAQTSSLNRMCLDAQVCRWAEEKVPGAKMSQEH